MIEHALQFGFAEAEALIGGETLKQIVLHDLAGAQVADGRDRVLLDRLVRAFAAGALFDRFHHHRGGQQEGQIAVQLGRDDGVEDLHLVEHGEQGFEQAIHGEEGIRQHDAADHGAGDVAFVPLIAGEPCGHGEVALQHHMQAVDALAGAAVHLVRHGGGADLALGKTFAGEFVAGHQAQRLGEVAGTAGEIAERAHDAEVEAARIHLADGIERFGQAEMHEDALLERARLAGIAIEKVIWSRRVPTAPFRPRAG